MEPVRNINSIQVFDVTARLGNVTRAAQSLNISQSSVSYHIKKLEIDLRVVLFHRKANGLELTDAGTILASHVAKGLASIRTGIETASRSAGAVRLAVLPMFASRFLSSRLGDLWETKPRLQLSIHNHNNTYARHPNPETFADIGIQWGRGNWDKFDVTPLWAERLVVVCSPDYLHRNPIAQPIDLQTCTLLHVDDERMWTEWFDDHGTGLLPDQYQMMLEDRHFQLSSTINGLGVSLFAEWLVIDELQSGVLVNPFRQSFETSFTYHLITPKDHRPSDATIAVRDWLLTVARRAT